AVVRRSVLAVVGGYREDGGPEDYDLWLRLLLHGHRAAKVPQVLLSWRDSPQRSSRNDPRYHRRRFFETKLAHFPAGVPRATPLQICGAGPTGRAWARALRARGYSVRRFIDVAVRRIGHCVDATPIDPPGALNREHGFILIAVGTRGAREAITDWLRSR